MCKKNCIKCHFFCIYIDHFTQGRLQEVVSQRTRDQIIEENNLYNIRNYTDSRTYLCCYREMWDEKKLFVL
jgi:hypothetical protein